jgi:hypothetical protein
LLLIFHSGKYDVQSFGAAAFFGFLTLGVYGYDAFLKFTGWRAGKGLFSSRLPDG